MINCEHDLVSLIGETDKEITEDVFEGRTHFYLNCLVCKTTLLRDENYLKDYVLRDVKVEGNLMYSKRDYVIEK